MTNLVFKIATVFLLTQFLVSCGAERDTAFNPSNNNNSSSAASLGASIPMTQIYEFDSQFPAQPASVDSLQKQIAVMRSEDEFEIYWQLYYKNLEPYSIDFEKEQVVLLDMGNIGNCTQAITYRNFKANEYSSDAVLVTFNYRSSGSNDTTSSSSSSSSSCDDLNELAKKRPFYFFKVETRKKILINESITFGNL